MNDWPTRAEIVAEAHTDVVNDTARPCVHEWRLINERPEYRELTETETSVLPRDAKKTRITSRWFCVHCRLIEETSA